MRALKCSLLFFVYSWLIWRRGAPPPQNPPFALKVNSRRKNFNPFLFSFLPEGTPSSPKAGPKRVPERKRRKKYDYTIENKFVDEFREFFGRKNEEIINFSCEKEV